MTPDPLAALKDRFRLRALEEADALDHALARGDAGRDEIERLAHGLAGSAGMFGEPAVGAAASAIDAEFAEGRPPQARTVRRLAVLIRQRLGGHS